MVRRDLAGLRTRVLAERAERRRLLVRQRWALSFSQAGAVGALVKSARQVMVRQKKRREAKDRDHKWRARRRKPGEGHAAVDQSAAWAVGVKWVCIMFYITYPQLCLATFSMLRPCHRLLDGTRWLHADYRIDCDSDGFPAQRALALASVLVYALGVPALYFALLYRVRGELFREATEHDKGAHYSEFDGRYHVINHDYAEQLGFLFSACVARPQRRQPHARDGMLRGWTDPRQGSRSPLCRVWGPTAASDLAHAHASVAPAGTSRGCGSGKFSRCCGSCSSRAPSSS